jgi:hypothetical protein
LHSDSVAACGSVKPRVSFSRVTWETQPLLEKAHHALHCVIHIDPARSLHSRNSLPPRACYGTCNRRPSCPRALLLRYVQPYRSAAMAGGGDATQRECRRSRCLGSRFFTSATSNPLYLQGRHPRGERASHLAQQKPHHRTVIVLRRAVPCEARVAFAIIVEGDLGDPASS